MAWKVEISSRCQKMLSKLDNPIKKQILDYLSDIEKLNDPRTKGESLSGPLRDFWRYRVGDFRVMCEIQDECLVVLVVKIARRDKVYK